MHTLGINTALKITEIALVSGGKVLAEKSWLSQNNESETLMPEIDKILKSKRLSYKDLEKIVVICGPGSFTGLRVGVSVANSISYIQQISVFEIDTFEFLRERNGKNAASTASAKEALVFFAGRTEVYVQLKEKEEPLILKIENLEEFLRDKRLSKVFGELTEDQKGFLSSIKFQKPKKTFGETLLSLLKGKKLKEVKIVEPLYIKSPGISAPKSIM